MSAPLAVAWCPGPPLLHPSVGVGLDAELGGLRAACCEAVSAVSGSGPETVVVLGGGPVSRLHASDAAGGFAGYGVGVQVGLGEPVLPLSLTIGAWLLAEAGWPGPRVFVEVGPAAPPIVDVDGPWSLLVIGDGSATRTDRAPGSFDPRAASFDASVVEALASGDPLRLKKIDDGQDVRATGVKAWHCASELLAGTTYDARVLADQAPYGVGYFVAIWT